MLLYFSLGANLGDREANLKKAIDLLTERVGAFVACSGFYETAPVGFASCHKFLNCACCIEAEPRNPLSIIELTEAIEREIGRRQKSEGGRHFDRPIDIDLLFADDIVLSTPRLTLPHPRLHERRFVLEPLAEIAPNLIHPVLKTSVREMLNNLNANEECSAVESSFTEERSAANPSAGIERVAEATPEVAAAVNHLLAQLSSTPRAFTLLQLAALVRTPLTHLFVLRDEAQTICGMATLCLTHQPTGCKAWIEDVVVDDNHRGHGYGRRLVEHLTATAFAMQATSVMLTSRPSRLAANALYRSAGFEQKETNVYVKKSQ